MIDSPLTWVVLFFFGTFTGVLSGLLGIGGGLLMVPALTVLGVPLVQATATSLIGVFLSAVSGSIRNLRAGELNWKVSLVLALFGMVTAQGGAWLGDRLPDTALSLGFAALLLLTTYLMNLRQTLKRKAEKAQLNQPEQAELEVKPDAEEQMKLPSVAGIGLLAGILSGLFGVGGGVVMVPLQMLLLAEPIKVAVRTSLGAIVAIAASGLGQHALNNNVLWIPGLCLGVGGILGAQVGARLLPKLPDRTVGLLFRTLLFALAAYMIVRTFR